MQKGSFENFIYDEYGSIDLTGDCKSVASDTSDDEERQKILEHQIIYAGKQRKVTDISNSISPQKDYALFPLLLGLNSMIQQLPIKSDKASAGATLIGGRSVPLAENIFKKEEISLIYNFITTRNQTLQKLCGKALRRKALSWIQSPTALDFSVMTQEKSVTKNSPTNVFEQNGQINDGDPKPESILERIHVKDYLQLFPSTCPHCDETLTRKEAIATLSEFLSCLPLQKLRAVLHKSSPPEVSNLLKMSRSLPKQKFLQEVLKNITRYPQTLVEKCYLNKMYCSIRDLFGFTYRLSPIAFELFEKVEAIYSLCSPGSCFLFHLRRIKAGAPCFPPYVCRYSAPLFTDGDQLLDLCFAKTVHDIVKVLLGGGKVSAGCIPYFLLRHRLNKAITAALAGADRNAIIYAVTDICEEEVQKYGDVTSSAKTKGSVSLPSFPQLTAGYVFTSIISLSLPLYEKSKKYDRAIHLYKLLLKHNLTAHRRGRWYNRLTILLFKRSSSALECLDTCIQCLNESDDITYCERIEIARRAFCVAKALTKKSSKSVWNNIPLHLHKLIRRIMKHGVIHDETKHHGSKLSQILSRPQDVRERVIVTTKNRTSSHRGKSVFSGVDGATIRVEELVLNYFLGKETSCNELSRSSLQISGAHWQNGAHCEGSVVSELFGLVFMDVIFLNIPDVFFTECQDHPLDFFTQGFYQKRKLVIDQKLEKISSLSRDSLFKIIKETVEENYGTPIVGVNWQTLTSLRKRKRTTAKEISSPTLQNAGEYIVEYASIAAAMGGKILAAIMVPLCYDYRYWKAGFPDLLFWQSYSHDNIDIDTINTSQIAFVEVKGPGDTLSEKQRCWLKLLTAAGAQCEVCHVQLSE